MRCVGRGAGGPVGGREPDGGRRCRMQWRATANAIGKVADAVARGGRCD